MRCLYRETAFFIKKYKYPFTKKILHVEWILQRETEAPKRAEKGKPWGISSVGRAPALHAGCQEFESPILHKKRTVDLFTVRFLFKVG